MTYWGRVSRNPGWSHVHCRVEAGLELLQWRVQSHTWFRARSLDQISTAVLCWQCPWWCLLTGSILLSWHLPHGLCEVTVFSVEVGEYFREFFFEVGKCTGFWLLLLCVHTCWCMGLCPGRGQKSALDFLELEMQACTGLLCRCWDLSSGPHCSASTLAAEPMLQAWIPCSLFSCNPLL